MFYRLIELIKLVEYLSLLIKLDKILFKRFVIKFLI